MDLLVRYAEALGCEEFVDVTNVAGVPGQASLFLERAFDGRGGSYDARYSLYDDSVGLDDAWGLGGRLGWFFADNWAIEADAGLIPAQTTVGAIDVNNTFVHVHLVRALPFGRRLALLLGGGWAYNSFSNGSSVSENGVGGLAGLRLRLGKRLALRGDVTADYMLDPAVSSQDNLHLGLQAGVSLLLGEGPGDKDKDGVLDDVDRCADTPAGTPVEAAGCPDADRDGVADQGDRCRDTPGGATVMRSSSVPSLSQPANSFARYLPLGPVE